MNRGDCLKVMAGLSAMSVCLRERATGSIQMPSGGEPVALGSQVRVFLGGLSRRDSEQAMRSAVRSVAEAATDFSWLSKDDAAIIKPALNSGNPYPATTSPTPSEQWWNFSKKRERGGWSWEIWRTSSISPAENLQECICPMYGTDHVPDEVIDRSPIVAYTAA